MHPPHWTMSMSLSMQAEWVKKPICSIHESAISKILVRTNRPANSFKSQWQSILNFPARRNKWNSVWTSEKKERKKKKKEQETKGKRYRLEERETKRVCERERAWKWARYAFKYLKADINCYGNRWIDFSTSSPTKANRWTCETENSTIADSKPATKKMLSNTIVVSHCDCCDNDLLSAWMACVSVITVEHHVSWQLTMVRKSLAPALAVLTAQYTHKISLTQFWWSFEPNRTTLQRY